LLIAENAAEVTAQRASGELRVNAAVADKNLSHAGASSGINHSAYPIRAWALHQDRRIN
jgi:hypothetical protein